MLEGGSGSSVCFVCEEGVDCKCDDANGDMLVGGSDCGSSVCFVCGEGVDCKCDDANGDMSGLEVWRTGVFKSFGVSRREGG